MVCKFDLSVKVRMSLRASRANAHTPYSAVVQALFGQLADDSVRRWPIIFAVSIFALGSGIAGGSNIAAMLIAGRTLQGIELGRVNMLIDITVCDLVP